MKPEERDFIRNHCEGQEMVKIPAPMLVRLLDALDAAEANQGWNPVTERLPACNGFYLIAQEGLPSAAIANFRAGHFYAMDAGSWYYRLTSVTHWMDLPNPPKEDER